MNYRPWTVARLLDRMGLGLVLLVLLLVVACGTPQAAEEADVWSDEATPRATLDAPPTLPAYVALAHQVAPDFRLPDLDGQTWTLTQFRPRPVMLFFWASW